MKEYIQIRNELTVYLIYLQLMTSLMSKDKGGITNRRVRSSLVEASEFSKKANEVEMIKKGPAVIKLLQEAAADYMRMFPPKAPLEQIAREFNDLCSKNKEIYSWGLEYGWLQKVMDCTNMGLPEGLPFHARIGVGHHAGFGNVEEDFLLRDAFLLLVLAEDAYEKMHAYAKYWDKAGKADDPRLVHEMFSTANQNVATYSRLCILSFFSFVEVFVNSVGYEFGIRNKNILCPKDIEILHGRKKGRYLSLEYKIETFPSIIRPDKKTPIVLSDPKPTKEPFRKFIKEIKEIRDSSVHYSPLKKAIWRRPDDWLDKGKSASKLCMEVSLAFWKACYPDGKGPEYLNGLDYGKHIDIAKKRIKLQDKMKGLNEIEVLND